MVIQSHPDSVIYASPGDPRQEGTENTTAPQPPDPTMTPIRHERLEFIKNRYLPSKEYMGLLSDNPDRIGDDGYRQFIIHWFQVMSNTKARHSFGADLGLIVESTTADPDTNPALQEHRASILWLPSLNPLKRSDYIVQQIAGEQVMRLYPQNIIAEAQIIQDTEGVSPDRALGLAQGEYRPRVEPFAGEGVYEQVSKDNLRILEKYIQSRFKLVATLQGFDADFFDRVNFVELVDFRKEGQDRLNALVSILLDQSFKMDSALSHDNAKQCLAEFLNILTQLQDCMAVAGSKQLLSRFFDRATINSMSSRVEFLSRGILAGVAQYSSDTVRGIVASEYPDKKVELQDQSHRLGIIRHSVISSLYPVTENPEKNSFQIDRQTFIRIYTQHEYWEKMAMEIIQTAKEGNPVDEHIVMQHLYRYYQFKKTFEGKKARVIFGDNTMEAVVGLLKRNGEIYYINQTFKYSYLNFALKNFYNEQHIEDIVSRNSIWVERMRHDLVCVFLNRLITGKGFEDFKEETGVTGEMIFLAIVNIGAADSGAWIFSEDSILIEFLTSDEGLEALRRFAPGVLDGLVSLKEKKSESGSANGSEQAENLSTDNNATAEPEQRVKFEEFLYEGVVQKVLGEEIDYAELVERLSKIFTTSDNMGAPQLHLIEFLNSSFGKTIINLHAEEVEMLIVFLQDKERQPKTLEEKAACYLTRNFENITVDDLVLIIGTAGDHEAEGKTSVLTLFKDVVRDDSGSKFRTDLIACLPASREVLEHISSSPVHGDSIIRSILQEGFAHSEANLLALLMRILSEEHTSRLRVIPLSEDEAPTKHMLPHPDTIACSIERLFYNESIKTPGLKAIQEEAVRQGRGRSELSPEIRVNDLKTIGIPEDKQAPFIGLEDTQDIELISLWESRKYFAEIIIALYLFQYPNKRLTRISHFLSPLPVGKPYIDKLFASIKTTVSETIISLCHLLGARLLLDERVGSRDPGSAGRNEEEVRILEEGIAQIILNRNHAVYVGTAHSLLLPQEQLLPLRRLEGDILLGTRDLLSNEMFAQNAQERADPLGKTGRYTIEDILGDDPDALKKIEDLAVNIIKDIGTGKSAHINIEVVIFFAFTMVADVSNLVKVPQDFERFRQDIRFSNLSRRIKKELTGGSRVPGEYKSGEIPEYRIKPIAYSTFFLLLAVLISHAAHPHLHRLPYINLPPFIQSIFIGDQTEERHDDFLTSPNVGRNVPIATVSEDNTYYVDSGNKSGATGKRDPDPNDRVIKGVPRKESGLFRNPPPNNFVSQEHISSIVRYRGSFIVPLPYSAETGYTYRLKELKVYDAFTGERISPEKIIEIETRFGTEVTVLDEQDNYDPDTIVYYKAVFNKFQLENIPQIPPEGYAMIQEAGYDTHILVESLKNSDFTDLEKALIIQEFLRQNPNWIYDLDPAVNERLDLLRVGDSVRSVILKEFAMSCNSSNAFAAWLLVESGVNPYNIYLAGNFFNADPGKMDPASPFFGDGDEISMNERHMITLVYDEDAGLVPVDFTSGRIKPGGELERIMQENRDNPQSNKRSGRADNREVIPVMPPIYNDREVIPPIFDGTTINISTEGLQEVAKDLMLYLNAHGIPASIPLLLILLTILKNGRLEEIIKQKDRLIPKFKFKGGRMVRMTKGEIRKLSRFVHRLIKESQDDGKDDGNGENRKDKVKVKDKDKDKEPTASGTEHYDFRMVELLMRPVNKDKSDKVLPAEPTQEEPGEDPPDKEKVSPEEIKPPEPPPELPEKIKENFTDPKKAARQIVDDEFIDELAAYLQRENPNNLPQEALNNLTTYLEGVDNGSIDQLLGYYSRVQNPVLGEVLKIVLQDENINRQGQEIPLFESIVSNFMIKKMVEKDMFNTNT
jgi:hypothetical protein